MLYCKLSTEKRGGVVLIEKMLKALIKNLGSQKRVAEAVGVSEKTVSNWKKKHKRPSKKHIEYMKVAIKTLKAKGVFYE